MGSKYFKSEAGEREKRLVVTSNIFHNRKPVKKTAKRARERDRYYISLLGYKRPYDQKCKFD